MPQQADSSIDNLDKAPKGELSSDQHAAALGFISTLHKGLLEDQQPQDQEGEQEDPQGGLEQQPSDQQDTQQREQGVQQQEGQIIDEIRTLKATMQNQDLRQEFQVVKNEIESILEEDANSTKETETTGA